MDSLLSNLTVMVAILSSVLLPYTGAGRHFGGTRRTTPPV